MFSNRAPRKINVYIPERDQNPDFDWRYDEVFFNLE